MRDLSTNFMEICSTFLLFINTRHKPSGARTAVPECRNHDVRHDGKKFFFFAQRIPFMHAAVWGGVLAFMRARPDTGGEKKRWLGAGGCGSMSKGMAVMVQYQTQ